MSGSFTSDFSQMGTGRSSMVFQGGGTDILTQEKALIDKVFGIVDKDNSGSIDTAEIKEMFHLFGIETKFLESAIRRIMQNVDKDQDDMISPAEFYKLLSMKFQKGDPKKDIDDVFHRINKAKNKEISVDELHEVAHQLGENIDKKEIKDMIWTFNQMYDETTSKEKKGPGATKKGDGKGQDKETEKEKDPKSDTKSVASEDEKKSTMTMDVWYHIMQFDL